MAGGESHTAGCMNEEASRETELLLPRAPVKLSPAEMLGLLRAGTSGMTRSLRAWEPPAVEVIREALPQYGITAFVARGGMGAVYRGAQGALNRPVAVKILPPDMVDDAMDFVVRFKREARAMATLSHPGIVAVHEAGETAEGLLYFVMEFVEGADVAQWIEQQGRLSAAEALRIAAEVCAALECAHAAGIIHRDIKPSNVLLDDQGVVKVADFGLAKFDVADGSATQSMVAVGSPDFLAPEAHIPGLKVDHRVDLYALGVMLYQMLTGKVPRGRFDPPSLEVPGLDPRLDAIIDKAMQSDRAKRYASATEMRVVMEEVMLSAGSFGSASKGIRRLKMMKAWAAFVALVVAGGTAWWMENAGARAAKMPALTGPSWSQMPTAEDKQQVFTNTLGMKFVPVPGTDVLFCIHETRKGDYAAYAAANPGVDGSWNTGLSYAGGEVSMTDEHPVVKVNAADVAGFCTWLGKKEGRTYRLPTDAEWSCAVGIGEREDAKMLPMSKAARLKVVYAWGLAWPPPPGAGNFADESHKLVRSVGDIVTGYDDGFATTAPVMSFAPNALGIYDLAGNVWERCTDWADAQHTLQVGRGSSFDNGERDFLQASVRHEKRIGERSANVGFRIVVEKASLNLAKDGRTVSGAP